MTEQDPAKDQQLHEDPRGEKYDVFRVGRIGHTTVKATDTIHAMMIVCHQKGLNYSAYHHQFQAMRTRS